MKKSSGPNSVVSLKSESFTMSEDEIKMIELINAKDNSGLSLLLD
jgi:hypothetical protein